jgi:EAL domain-containing protein (putative c-di-GMP-specific phosphodiesterase class I)
MISDKERVEIVFRMLKALGISISIDDFGSGYSALGYLNEYPFDRIKIDKSLIDNISSYNTSGKSIVKAAITMAKAVSIKTIAEGVETPEQLEILIELGCDQAQGYLLGRPVPADVFEQRFIRLQE